VLGFLGLLAMAVEAPGASFQHLMETMRNFQESRVLLAAVELDVFTAVGQGGTAAEVASRLGTHPRSTEMLLNALVALGALTKTKGVYRNTPETARYLVAGSPENQRPALMHTVNVWKAWTTLTDCVRAGTAVIPPGVEGRDPAWSEAFIAAMHRGALAAAPALVATVGAAGVRRLIDLGGGSGAYSIAFARANPELRAEVLDLASVVPIAEKHIAEAGLGDRVKTRVGDLLTDEFGSGYDLALLSAICHMFSPEENWNLLRRTFRALVPGGRVVIRDFILEPDKTAPKWAVLFALNTLVATRGGATYTEAEYTSWLEEAGFVSIERPQADLIVARRP